MVRLSEKDKKIIELLYENAENTYVNMAKELNVTEAAVRKRVKKLEENGVITGYTVKINPKKAGDIIICIVGFDILPEKMLDTIERVKGLDEIKSLYLTTGDHMVIAECLFENRRHFNEFISMLNSIDGITNVRPAIVVERLK